MKTVNIQTNTIETPIAVLTHVIFVLLQVGRTGGYINRKNTGFRRRIINSTTTCPCGRIVIQLVLAKVAYAVDDKVRPDCSCLRLCSLCTNRSFCVRIGSRHQNCSAPLQASLLSSIASVPSHSTTALRLNALLCLGIVKPSAFMETLKSEYEPEPKQELPGRCASYRPNLTPRV